MTLARRYLPAVLEARQGVAETVPHLDAHAVRHQSAGMTLRYMKTLSARRGLEIHQTVDLGVTWPHRQRARRYPNAPPGRAPGRSY